MDVRIGHAEFDALAPQVYVGWCEFDCSGAEQEVMRDPVGGKGRRNSFTSAASAAPLHTPSRYHDRYADDELAAALAAELDDEEAVLTLLMMEFQHAV